MSSYACVSTVPWQLPRPFHFSSSCLAPPPLLKSSSVSLPRHPGHADPHPATMTNALRRPCGVILAPTGLASIARRAELHLSSAARALPIFSR